MTQPTDTLTGMNALAKTLNPALTDQPTMLEALGQFASALEAFKTSAVNVTPPTYHLLTAAGIDTTAEAADVTVTGLVVGDVISRVLLSTAGVLTDETTSFTSPITVVNKLRQAIGHDYSGGSLLVFVKRG